MQETEVYQPKNANKAPIRALAIMAHHDDTEISSSAPMLEFYDGNKGSFATVVLTDGAGSARSGAYASVTDSEMVEIRKVEQRNAAELGHYARLWMLNYTSAEIRGVDARAVAEVAAVLREVRPDVLYVHNPFDKHPTHRGALRVALQALEVVRSEYSPKRVLAGEVWRDLDWLPDSHKVVVAVDSNPELALNILKTFDSQIEGGKAYDLAATGRRYAHATFSESHSVDNAAQLAYFCDITDVANGKTALADFVSQVVKEFSDELGSYYQK